MMMMISTTMMTIITVLCGYVDSLIYRLCNANLVSFYIAHAIMGNCGHVVYEVV